MPTVQCNVCSKVAETLNQPPMGGAIGDQIMLSVCRDCWATWLDQQARVINHYGLQLAFADDRKRLMGYMKEFLKLESP